MAAWVGSQTWRVAFLATLVAILYREGREPTGQPGELQALHLDADEAAGDEALVLLQSRSKALRQAGAPLNALEPTAAPVEQRVDVVNDEGIATGPWGFDLSGMMDNLEPGRDFYGYANGKWLRRTSIPPDQSSWSQFSALDEQASAQVRGLLEQGAKDGTETGLFYKAFMDEELVEQLGTKPLQPILDRVRQIETHLQFAVFAGTTQFGYGSAPLALGVGADPKDPEMNVAQLSQSGLGLPSRDYYLQPRFAEMKAAYQRHVATMLGLVGWQDPAQAAADVVAFEDSIARVSWDKERLRDPVLNYNKMAVADLQDHLPGFHWEAFMQAAGGVPQNATIIVKALNQTARDGVVGIVDLVRNTDIRTLKSWEAWHIVNSAATVLPKAFVDADFAFFGQTLRGQAEIKPRWKRGVAVVNQQMGDAVGKQYVEKFFPESSKAVMNELTGLLKQAFEQRVRASVWMTDATKQRALAKLASFKFETGYPEKFRDYAGVTIDGKDLYGNMEKAFAFAWNFDRGFLGQPVDHGYWDMTPQTVNAFYSTTENKCVFLAAILQPPFYNPFGDMAVNFGGIGAVIGHEMTHGFDDSGRKYDGQGRLEDWWTPADAAEFDRRAEAFGGQFWNFSTGIPAGMHIRPGLTMGENLADLGGLTIAYDALQLWLRNHTYQPHPPLLSSASDGHEADRRFFLGWAQVWRAKYTKGALEQRLTTDPHSPGQARGSIPPRNIGAWYSAFNITPDDPLYLDKALRAQIW